MLRVKKMSNVYSMATQQCSACPEETIEGVRDQAHLSAGLVLAGSQCASHGAIGHVLGLSGEAISQQLSHI